MTPPGTVQEFCLRLIQGETLEEKLAPPPRDLPDVARGDGSVPEAPGRPATLRIVPGREARVPPLAGWGDLDQRVRIIHALANHELQATELFARALVQFPDAPGPLRQELLRTLAEEQVHTRLYVRRLEALGGAFGDHPVSGLFWNRLRETRTIAEFLCALSLTFENANLDHAPEIAATARLHGDEETARILDRVAKDEERHVDRRQLFWPLHPGRARGEAFQTEARRRAGLDPEFIENLRAAESEVPESERQRRPTS
jgi:uncharacterized ferritin-like protein (DUF455 family)